MLLRIPHKYLLLSDCSSTTIPTVQMGQLRFKAYKDLSQAESQVGSSRPQVSRLVRSGDSEGGQCMGTLHLSPSVAAQPEGVEKNRCSEAPSSSKQTLRARSRWKLPTQGPAPNLPETCKHETIVDETRLESYRF